MPEYKSNKSFNGRNMAGAPAMRNITSINEKDAVKIKLLPSDKIVLDVFKNERKLC